MDIPECLICLKYGELRLTKQVQTETLENCDNVKSHLDVEFVLHKILEIPEKLTYQVFQDFGDPCEWIKFCDVCLVEMEKVNHISNEIIRLNDEYKKLKSKIKNVISTSVDLENRVNNYKDGAKEIVRSYVYQAFKDVMSASAEVQKENECSSSNNYISESTEFPFSSDDESYGSDVDNGGGNEKTELKIEYSSEECNSNSDEHPEDAHSDYDMESRSVNASNVQDSADKSHLAENTCGNNDQYKTYKSKERAEKNNPNESDGRKSRHACHLCEKTYKTHRALAFHKRHIHKVVRSYKCDPCKLEFATIDAFKSHTIEHSKQNNKCGVCGKDFKSLKTLKGHCRLKHNGTSHECKICGKDFETEDKLAIHLKFHDVVQPYKCNFCEERFKDEHRFKNHVKLHSAEGNKHFCDICGKCFSTRRNFRKHYKRHGEKTFHCTICDKRFIERAGLRKHLLMHSGVRPNKCEQCDYATRFPNELRDHVRRCHTGEKPFSCEICQKSFFSKTNLRIHIKTHRGVNLFKCDMCDRSYSRMVDVKRHKKKHTEVA